MTFLGGLVSIAGSVTARVLLALGFSVTTIAGATVAIDTIKGQIMDNLSSGSAAILQLAGLAGAWDALGIIFGVATFGVGFYTATTATRILGSAGP